MFSDAKIFFRDKTFFFLVARFFIGTIFFSRSKKKTLFSRKKILAVRKLFCHDIKKKFLGIRNHFCESFPREQKLVTQLSFFFFLFFLVVPEVRCPLSFDFYLFFMQRSYVSRY